MCELAPAQGSPGSPPCKFFTRVLAGLAYCEAPTQKSSHVGADVHDAAQPRVYTLNICTAVGEQR